MRHENLTFLHIFLLQLPSKLLCHHSIPVICLGEYAFLNTLKAAPLTWLGLASMVLKAPMLKSITLFMLIFQPGLKSMMRQCSFILGEGLFLKWDNLHSFII